MEWVFDGGRPCVDLVNTLRDRKLGGRELLVDVGALAEWLTLAGLPAPRGRVGNHYLIKARELREAVDRVLRVVSAGERPAVADVRLLNVIAAAEPAPVLELHIDARGRPCRRTRTPADPAAAALSVLAADAIDLVTTSPEIRICVAHDCGLRFLDASPKRNRQWCSMARCGNRAKARAHYARRAHRDS
jgi:predicted RNA-binding Zn ribbon-like protein